MITYNKVLSCLTLLFFSGAMTAQNGVTSPYSRYGFGLLSDQSTTANKGMGGISYGLRGQSMVNVGNPASYSGIDSLTYLFDAGVTLQNTNYDNGTLKMNVKNSSLDYLAMQFRAFRNVGMTAGFIPYSKINYSFSSSSTVREDEDGSVISSVANSGSGGLSQAFVGVGAKVVDNLSVGANLSYLWGDVDHTITNSYSGATAWSYTRSYTSEIKTYKLDLGLQYTMELSKKRSLTLGLTYSLGHHVDADAYRVQYTSDTSTSSTQIINQRIDTIGNAYQLPHTFGIGAAYVYDKRFTVGLDYTYQKWAGVKYPYFKGSGETTAEEMDGWEFRDVHKLAVGMEYIPSFTARSIFKRMRYRLGGYYSNPYIKVKGTGFSEFGVGGAVVVPIFNSHSSRASYLSVSAEYVNVSPKSGLIKENYLKLGVGLTFGQIWFYKWKVQ